MKNNQLKLWKFLTILLLLLPINVFANISIDPQKACKWLNDSGFKMNSYSKLEWPEGNWNYGCFSSYKILVGGGMPPNNIAYYVYGNKDTVRELQLFLNVNYKPKAKAAQWILSNFSDDLFQKAFGFHLPPKIHTAIERGEPGKWKIKKGIIIQLIRDNWPTGKGYSLNFSIK